MNKRIISILLIIFLSSSTLVQSTKIQKDDSWSYTDQDNTEYNETALEVIHLKDSISVIKVNTDRDIEYEFNHQGINFETNLSLIYDFVYLTQEGAIPFLFSNTKANGKITFNDTVYNINGSDGVWLHNGNPPLAFTSTTDIYYDIGFYIMFDTYQYSTWKQYIITTNNNVEDKIRNYTISLVDESYNFENITDGYYELLYHYKLSETNLHLNSFASSMLLSYEEGINLPVYVAQTDPVKIEGMKLSEDTKLIEYFLVREVSESISIDSITNNTSFYLSLFVFIPVILIRKLFNGCK